MHASHLQALQEKHQKLEKTIHEELLRPASNDALIGELKKKKLYIKEEIERRKESDH